MANGRWQMAAKSEGRRPEIRREARDGRWREAEGGKRKSGGDAKARVISTSSVPEVKGPDKPVLYQSGKLMLAGKVPTQVLTTAGALTIRPGMARKPRMLEGGDAGLAATMGLGKGYDVKTESVRV